MKKALANCYLQIHALLCTKNIHLFSSLFSLCDILDNNYITKPNMAPSQGSQGSSRPQAVQCLQSMFMLSNKHHLKLKTGRNLHVQSLFFIFSHATSMCLLMRISSHL